MGKPVKQIVSALAGLAAEARISMRFQSSFTASLLYCQRGQMTLQHSRHLKSCLKWLEAPASPCVCVSVFSFHVYACVCVCVCISHFSRVRLFATPWTVVHQAPLSMGFSKQEYWNGLPCPPPRDLPNPGIEPMAPALQRESLPLSHQGAELNL